MGNWGGVEKGVRKENMGGRGWWGEREELVKERGRRKSEMV